MTDAEIFDLFQHRCVVCWQPATEINHINPRSRSKAGIDDPMNKVTLCHKHHDEYHQGGVTHEKLMKMRRRRKDYLDTIGKHQYA